jgi:hypothetical protein
MVGGADLYKMSTMGSPAQILLYSLKISIILDTFSIVLRVLHIYGTVKSKCGADTRKFSRFRGQFM